MPRILIVYVGLATVSVVLALVTFAFEFQDGSGFLILTGLVSVLALGALCSLATPWVNTTEILESKYKGLFLACAAILVALVALVGYGMFAISVSTDL